MRVLEPRGEFDLAREPFSAERGAEIRAKDLERDLSFVTKIGRQIDGCHPATTQLALDRVPAGKRGSEALLRRCGQ